MIKVVIFQNCFIFPRLSKAIVSANHHTMSQSQRIDIQKYAKMTTLLSVSSFYVVIYFITHLPEIITPAFICPMYTLPPYLRCDF